MDLQNKNVVVTGAASGIGAALVRQLCQKPGTRILAADLRPSGFEQGQVSDFVGDLSDQAGVDALFAHAEVVFGQAPDVFFANAGFAYYETLGPPDWEHIERIFSINTLAPLYILQQMKHRHPAPQPYAVVMTASAIAKMGIPGLALYGATKAALDRFADAYAFENEDAGLLSLVYPVSTRTSFFERAVEPGRLPMPVPFPSSSAEEVASAVVRGVERGRRHIFPSRLFWGARFFQAAFEVLVWPYQWFYAQKLRKWVKSRT